MRGGSIEEFENGIFLTYYKLLAEFLVLLVLLFEIVHTGTYLELKHTMRAG